MEPERQDASTSRWVLVPAVGRGPPDGLELERVGDPTVATGREVVVISSGPLAMASSVTVLSPKFATQTWVPSEETPAA